CVQRARRVVRPRRGALRDPLYLSGRVRRSRTCPRRGGGDRPPARDRAPEGPGGEDQPVSPDDPVPSPAGPLPEPAGVGGGLPPPALRGGARQVAGSFHLPEG